LGHAEYTVTMSDGGTTRVQIRTGPYFAVRFNYERWLRLPDLASICWYIAKTDRIQGAEVDDSTVGYHCLRALAQLGATYDDMTVGGGEYEWDGRDLLPDPNQVPYWLVVAEERYEVSGMLNHDGGSVYLIEVDGTYYHGGGEAGWTQMGQFASPSDATAWFWTHVIGKEPEDRVTR